MDAGLRGKNNHVYISIHQLRSRLKPEFVDVLPGFHALMGTDYTASFMGKGKVRLLKLISKSVQYTETLSQLGEDDDVADELIKQVELFVCHLYWYPNQDNVRFMMFEKKNSPKDDRPPLDRIRGLNPSTMPLCYRILVNKVRRVNFVSAMWKRACSIIPITYSPVENG